MISGPGGKPEDGLLVSIWKSNPSMEKLFPLVLFLLVFLGAYVFVRFYKKQEIIRFSFRWAEIPAVFIFLALLIFNILAVQFYPNSEIRVVPLENLPRVNIYFLLALFWQFLWITGLFLTSLILGKFLRKVFPEKMRMEDKLLEILLLVALGTFGWTMIIFALGLFGLIKSEIILAIAGTILLTQIRQLKSLAAELFKKRKVFVSLKNYSVFIWAALAFLLVLNLIDSLRPVPVGFDDTTYYLNRVNLMSERNSLVAGGTPFVFELIGSAGQVISKNASLVIGTNVLFSILGFLTLYGLGRYLFNRRTAIISASIWFFLPIVSHFIYREVKPDLMLFFVSVLIVWLFFLWLEKKNNWHRLFPMAFLAGFAYTIKLTAVFLFLPLFLVFIFFWKTWQEPVKNKIRVILLSLIFFILPLLPWIFLVFKTNNHLQFSSLIQLQSKNPKSIDIRNEFEKIGVDSRKCQFTSVKEDLERFGGEEKTIKKLLLLPWNLTMNTSAKLVSVEISFLFLAFLPLLIFFRKDVAKEKPEDFRKIRILFLMAIVYWIFWALFGNFVIWYGLAGFIFLTLLVAYLYAYDFQSKWIKIFLIIGLFLFLLTSTLLRIWRFGGIELTKYLSKKSASEEIYFYKTRNILKKVNINQDSKILVTMGVFPYFIKNNDQRMLFDTYLDNFNCLDNERDDAKTLDKLKRLNYRYLLLNKNMTQMEINPKGTLHQKVERAYQFAFQNLILVSEDSEVYLFEIP